MEQMKKQEEWIIYVTTNLINKKIYVGMRELKGNNSDDKYLGSGTIFKRALEKYGKENFHREILQYCYSAKETDIEEVYWIEKLDARNPDIGYNLHRGGFNQSGENNASYGSKVKKVKCVETGIIYRSQMDAAKAVNLKSSTSINGVCNGRYITAANCHWEFVDEEIVIKSPNRISREVYCITNDTIYKNPNQAAILLGLRKAAVKMVLKKQNSHAAGFKFRYLDEEYVEFIPKNKVRIKCLNDGQEFNSANEAARYYKICVTNIFKILRGEKVYVTELKFKKLTNDE